MDLNGLCAIKFEATWCGPCKAFEPNLKKIQAEFPAFRFISVNVDNEPQLAKQYKIRSLPTVILLNDGSEIGRVTGAVLMEPLRKAFREAAAKQKAA